MVEKKIVEIDGQKMVMSKCTHDNLPSYIWMPVSEEYFKPKPIIGNIGNIKDTNSRFYYVGEPNKQYYETITYENS